MQARSCRLKRISGHRVIRRSQAKAFQQWLRFFSDLDHYKDLVELEQPSDNLNQNKFQSRYPINTEKEFNVFFGV